MMRTWMILALLVGCAKKTEPVAPAAKPAPVEAAPAEAAPAEAAPAAKVVKAPIIDPVLFTSGSTSVDAAGDKVIAEAVGILKASDWNVLVLGLADATGDAEQNKELSQKRADAVAAKLRAEWSGAEDRIKVRAIGERLATGDSEAAERKVEFVFFEDEGLPMKEVVKKSGVLTEDFRKAKAAK